MKKLMIALACLIPIGAVADTPTPPAPVIAEIFECTLNDGVSASDMVTFGSNDVRRFTEKNNLRMNAYLWEAVAVNEPYREPDVRWVNYYPSWGDYYGANNAFNTKGTKLVEKFYSMVTCDKPVLLGSRILTAELVVAQQKPLIASVCNLKGGKTPADGAAFMSQILGLANNGVGGSMMVPAFGISGFDYVGTLFGTAEDMAGLMDSVRDGSMPAAMRSAGIVPPADCVNDLHMSHLMIQMDQ